MVGCAHWVTSADTALRDWAKFLTMGTDAYRALADPTRRQILKLLRQDDLSAGTIAEQFAISWPSVSRHLTVLSSAGLVQSTRRGQQLVYSSTSSVLAEVMSELAEMAPIGVTP
jgi:ArsR family transcriptional regulator, arsenate/arsenite/antimonite-responsive transcriptional repressor